jgi:nucleoside-diphosphate-sugar epimerase
MRRNLGRLSLPDRVESSGGIAVIGAGGFLASSLLDATHEWSSANVVAVVRGVHSLAGLLRRPVDISVTGGRQAELIRSLAGVATVIDVSVGKADEITDSARMLVRACREAGVRRVVYVSSAAAQPIRRHSIGRRRPGSYYGRQKAVAERELATLGEHEVDVTIFRPGLIWGPRSPWTMRHIRTLLRGTAIAPSRGDVSAPHLAYAPNLADALLRAATASSAAVGTFDFADTWWDSWDSYGRALAAAIGVSYPRAASADVKPGPRLALIAEAVTQVPRIRRVAESWVSHMPTSTVSALRGSLRPVPPPWHIAPLSSDLSDGMRSVRMTQGDIDVFLRWREPSQQIRALLGLHERVSCAEALLSTAAWARAAGFAPPVSSPSAVVA